MTSVVNRQWRLKRRPSGAFSQADFDFTTAPVPEPADGQFLVRVVYLSVDPTQRIWASQDSYLPMQPIGEVMRGIGIGVVEKSRNSRFPDGLVVSGVVGMQEYALSDGQRVNPVPPGVPLTAGLAVLGHIGMTAYFGLTDIGQAKPGETLVVSGAAGAVGSLAGQIGKILGCRVVGIAGTDDKCQWIRGALGFDAAINYRKEDVSEALKRHCPRGIDVVFENVGGALLDAVLEQLNLKARIALCGMISDYTREQGQGITNLRHLIFKRARVEGFLVMDYAPRAMEAMQALGGWLREGKLKYQVDMVQGLDNAVRAMNRLLTGANTGKVIVQVSEEPTR
jgi:NADPH-dependent curcumin reductase CurA